MAELVGAAVGRRVRVLSLPPILPRGASVLAEASAWVSRRPVFLTRDKVRDILEPHQSCVPERAERALGWSATRRFDGGAREAYLDYRRRGWL